MDDKMKRKISYAYQSITGKRRFNNQDNLCVNGLILPENHSDTRLHSGSLNGNDHCSFCVFDGLGGEAHGQKASYLAAESYSNYHPIFHGNEDYVDKQKAIHRLVLKMNENICIECKNLKCKTMGTTMAGLSIFDNEIYGYNLGDSRIYCYKNKKLEQKSRDHVPSSFLMKKAGLTQFLGIDPKEVLVLPDLFLEESTSPMIFLLCSDGVSKMLSDQEMEEIMNHHEEDPALIVKELLHKVEDKGAVDNATVIVVKV